MQDQIEQLTRHVVGNETIREQEYIISLIYYLFHRKEALKYLIELDRKISNEEISLALNDTLFPFVRQIANHDRKWFDSQNWSNLHRWLEMNLESEEFKICMKKYPQWLQE